MKPLQNHAHDHATCPNEKCIFHALSSNGRDFLIRDGYYLRRSYPTRVQRFRCRNCHTRFSDSTYTLDYWNRRRGLSHQIFRLFCEGLANRQIARILSADEKTIRLRLIRMSQQALLEHSLRTSDLRIHEPIAFDGVENFARSQYEPNNIHQAIGYKSHFIYDFNFAPLNRKGRMSDRQRKRKAEIESLEGSFDKSAIRFSARLIFERLARRCSDPQGLEIYSDEHFQYRRAIQQDLAHLKFRHLTISSKATRLYRHILFPVNHLDLLLRHHNKAFTRETISFSKTHGTMIQRYALLMAWKNYFRTKFTKRHKRDPRTNIETPAMAVGITQKVENFHDFFNRRKLPTQIQMNGEWQKFYRGEHTFPRTKPA